MIFYISWCFFLLISYLVVATLRDFSSKHMVSVAMALIVCYIAVGFMIDKPEKQKTEVLNTETQTEKQSS